MRVEQQIAIRGSRAAVWKVITDIANFASFTSGIQAIEIVEQPAHGLVGLRWRETRLLFGSPATVEKRITNAVERESYETAAEDGGFLFVTTLRIVEQDGRVRLISTHDSLPQTFAARIKGLPMVFFRGVLRKAILQDLNDIKAVVERGNS